MPAKPKGFNVAGIDTPKESNPAPRRGPRTVRLVLTRGDLLTLIRGLRLMAVSAGELDVDRAEYARLAERFTEQFQAFNQEEK